MRLVGKSIFINNFRYLSEVFAIELFKSGLKLYHFSELFSGYPSFLEKPSFKSSDVQCFSFCNFFNNDLALVFDDFKDCSLNRKIKFIFLAIEKAEKRLYQ